MQQQATISKKISNAKQVQIVPGMCGICPAGCGVNIHLVDGRIERLSPLKNHPQGIVCPRGMRAGEIVYSKDRLLYPQRRNKTRRNFERITWGEAYTQIVDNLQQIARKYGPEAICIYTGRGNFEFGLNEMFAPNGTAESSANAVLFPFGSPNTTGVGSLCYASYGMLASRACFGDYIRNVEEDIDHADLILVWGENPATDSPPINVRRIRMAQKRGARVIVIDHRRSESARALDAEWVGVRPGTDGALALGVIHVLLKKNLYDHHFVESWTHGFDALRAYVQNFSPARVEQITGVPAERMVDLAVALAQAQGCSILTYSGLEYSNSGVQAIRALWILQALAGHLDVPGGKLFKMRNRLQLNRLLTDPPSPEDAPKPIGADEYPLYYETRQEAHAALLPRAILENKPYPLRALIISGASLITSWPNPDLWRQALAALDFLVVINRFPTADGLYAHLLLPATTMFEMESVMIYDGYLQLRQRVIEPLGEARNDYLIFAELAQRLGYGDRWPQTETEMVEYMLRNTGVTLAQLRAHPEGISYPRPLMTYRKYETGQLRDDGRPGFNTPTGKFEITSEWLRQHGYEPLPVYTEPVEGPLAAPALAQHYPLVFNSGARTQFAFRSQHHNIPSLVARQPEPLVHLHRQDAQKRGIADGDEVFVISPRGRVTFRARVTEDIVPGVVEANMGGGGPLGPLAWQQANVNELTDFDNRDPLSGFPVYKALLCDVVKVETTR
ncbi:MAG: molybdopterin-dependent oxidoreductase [Anaerolineae bacterium]|nr:molybdopterin-dependent oxidoreductase [Anaerolineae bacterium]